MVKRGQRAQELLRDDLLAESFQAVETDIIEQIRIVKLDDRESHVRLVTALQISTAMRRKLWHMVQDGAAAVEHLDLRGRRID